MKRVAIGCLVAAGIVIGLGVAGIWFWLIRELPMLDASIELPLEAEPGTSISMTVTVINRHSGRVTLDSIDIDESFLSGFQVSRVNPKPVSTTRLPIIEQRSWEFGRVVQPGESLAVTFTLRPVMEGRFTGDVDVCNPNQDFRTLLADVVVARPEAGEAGAVPEP